MKDTGQEGRRMFMRGSRLFSPSNSYESSSVSSPFSARSIFNSISMHSQCIARSSPHFLSLFLERFSFLPFFNTRLFASISILLKASSRLLVITGEDRRDRYWNTNERDSFLCIKVQGSLLDCEDLGESAGFVVIVSCASQVLRKML